MIDIKGIKKIITLMILALAVFGSYSVWNNYSEQEGLDEGGKISVIPTKVGEGAEAGKKEPQDGLENPTPDDRDNQRVKDLAEISAAIDEFAKFNKGIFPETGGYEKISEEDNYVFKLLRRNGYLKKIYKDPLSGSYFYGYKSNGNSYELTASLEDREDVRCVRSGELCIFIIKKP